MRALSLTYSYLQFFFNLSLVLLFLYLVVQFVLTVQRDVEQRISEYSMGKSHGCNVPWTSIDHCRRADIVQEIALCSLQFKNNLCATNPIPAMSKQCASWETCMNRDPTIVGRAKVGAEMIAEVVNGFVEPISWKTLVSGDPIRGTAFPRCPFSFADHPALRCLQGFTLASLSFLTVFINSLPSLYRSRHHAAPAVPPPHHPSYPIAPVSSYPQHLGQYLPPASSPAWQSVDDPDLQAPSRRRRLEGGAAAKIK